MGKFSNVAGGIRKRKPSVLPLPGAHLIAATGKWEGPTEAIELRALKEDEYTDVLQKARAFAKEHGIDDPEDTDPIYQRGVALHTLAVAVIDPDSPVEKPAPFFDGGWEQIHTSELLTPEVISYLHQQQVLYQDEVSPLIQDLTPEEFMAVSIRTAGGDMSFFVGSRPGTLWSYLRFLAKLHVSSLTPSLPSSQPSASQTPTKS